MSNLLKGFVEKELDNRIKNTYPHMQYPSAMLAKIVKVSETNGKRYCTLKILDKNKNNDNRFPEIPFVMTEIPFRKNEIAVILLLYGECNPFIIGRYE